VATVEVTAEIAGSVWKIVASVGQELDEDDPIVILESMKMEIPVVAPESGRITEILVAEGESVTDGTVIARMEC